jgi:hypothetical protein
VRTSTLVQATADVVTIVSLRRGDVYKRLEEPTYGGTSLHFGVVTDVMHNGSDAVIVALEFPMLYGGAPVPTLKTYGTSADLKLFAAQPEEVRQYFSEVLDASAKAVTEADEKAMKARGVDTQVRAAIGQFTDPVFAIELTPAITGTPEPEPAEDEDSDDDTVADF